MPKTFHSIQFLRFVAAMLVVFDHAQGGASSQWPASHSATVDYIFNFGASGVHIFFVISGFVMVLSTFDAQSPRMTGVEFLRRRFIRIFPAYWAYSLLYLAVDRFAHNATVSPAPTLASLLLLPGYTFRIIGPGWTLAYELYFYFCFALVIGFGKTRDLVFLSALFVASIFARPLHPVSHPIVDLVTNPLLLEFLAGAWSAHILTARQNLNPRFAYILICLSLAGFLAGCLTNYNHYPLVLAWGLPSAALIFGCAILELNGGLSPLIIKISFLGDSSYSLYLLHMLLLSMLIAIPLLSPHTLPARLAITITLAALCCPISILAYKYIESPLLLYMRRRTSRRIPQEAHLLQA